MRLINEDEDEEEESRGQSALPLHVGHRIHADNLVVVSE